MFPQWFRTSVISTGAHYYPKFDYLPQIFRAKTVLTNLAQELGDAYFTTRSAFRDAGLDAVLSRDAHAALQGYSPRSEFRDRFKRYRHLGPLEQLQAVDLETWLPGDILVKADRTTMAYSLESRSPWLDHRIGELAFRLPAAFKLHGNIGKYVFKKAVEPLVPGPLIWRPKLGFSVPLAEWFHTSLRPVFESIVLNESMEQYLSLGEVRRLWNQHQSKLHNHDQKLWVLLMLACWENTHRQPSQKSLLDEALSSR
jgi:asparagine synthase (glutamine-hydrolysing)